MSDSDCFITGLAKMELDFLTSYKKLVSVEKTAVQLNQDPADHA